MANAKNSDFITRSRQAATGLLESISKLNLLREEWDSLYNATISAADFGEGAGTNGEITLTDLTALMTTQAALDTLMDAGHRTNILKVK